MMLICLEPLVLLSTWIGHLCGEKCELSQFIIQVLLGHLFIELYMLKIFDIYLLQKFVDISLRAFRKIPRLSNSLLHNVFTIPFRITSALRSFLMPSSISMQRTTCYIIRIRWKFEAQYMLEVFWATKQALSLTNGPIHEQPPIRWI